MADIKFKLTDEYKVNSMGVKVFRIEATASWGSIKKGDKGGFIEKEANLSGDAWVYGDAQVYGSARVYGSAWVSGDAQVSGDARVYGDAQVYGSARVYGDAWVYGSAWVSGSARVSGDAWVSGDAQVSGDARVYGDAWVSGDAQVSGDARVYGDAQVYGDARVYGSARVSLKKDYTKGNFVYSSDSEIQTTIIDQSDHPDFDSSYGYKNLLVIGEYEIKDREPQETTNPKEITVNGATYVLKVNDKYKED